MTSVGLIVNPSAARDVRRLTSLARTIDFPERVNVVARILAGLRAGGATEIWTMPTTEGVDGAIVPRTLVVLSLTFDHQVVDGAPAAAFLEGVVKLLEEPDRLFL